MNKTCKNCGSEVPYYVTRCKHCFGDFRELNKKKKISLLLPIFVFSLGLLGFLTTQQMAKTQISKQAIVELESETLVMLEMDINGLHSKRIPFTSINSLEYVLDTNLYELFIINNQGDRILIFSAMEDIKKRALHMAEMMNKKLNETNNIRIER